MRPVDQDGLNQKIFYFHVAIALTAYTCFAWGGWKALRVLWTMRCTEPGGEHEQLPGAHRVLDAVADGHALAAQEEERLHRTRMAVRRLRAARVPDLERHARLVELVGTTQHG